MSICNFAFPFQQSTQHSFKIQLMHTIKNLIFASIFMLSFSIQATSQTCEELTQNLTWSFEAQDTMLQTGDPFYVECRVENFTNVLSFQYTINFDAEHIQFDSIDLNESPLIGPVEFNPDPAILADGILGIIWTNQNAEGQTIPDSSIFKIFFTAIGEPEECSSLDITSDLIALEIAWELPNGDICAENDIINLQNAENEICIGCGPELFVSTVTCNDNIDISICGGNPPYNYRLEGPSTIFMANLPAAGTGSFGLLEEGTYELTVTDVNGSEIFLTIEIMNFEQPDVNITPVNVCNESNQAFPSIVDLTQFISTSDSYTLEDPNGNPVNDPVVDFTGQAPGEYIYRVVFGSESDCPNIHFDLIVTVLDCSCPEVVLFNLGSYCNNQNIELNLGDFLSSETEAGSFDVQDESNTSLTLEDNNIFQIENASPGIYKVTYTLDEVVAGCPSSSQSTFEVFEAPNPIFSAPEPICNSDSLDNNTILDLNDLVSNANGVWEDMNGNIITEPIDFNGTDAGIQNFTFTTTDAEAPCQNTSTSISINIINCLTSTSDITTQQLVIYPNPSFDFISINASQEFEYLEIVNTNGQSILKTAFKNKLDISSYPPGVYILKLSAKDSSQAIMTKFIKLD